MNRLEKAKYESYVRILAYCDKYHTELGTISGFNAFVIILGKIMEDIMKAAINQDVETSGAVKIVDEIKKAMAGTTVSYGLIGAVQARGLGNTVLDDALTRYVSYIYQVPKTVALVRANEIRDLLNDNLTILTDVTAANITEIDDLIKKYKEIQELPEGMHAAKKEQGTEKLLPEYKIADDAVSSMHDLIYATYQVKDPSMVGEFDQNKRLANYGIRHTGLIVSIEDKNGNALEGIKINIKEVERSAISDIKGNAIIAKFKAGTYHVEFSGEGWETKSLILSFKRGDMLEMEIELEKK